MVTALWYFCWVPWSCSNSVSKASNPLQISICCFHAVIMPLTFQTPSLCKHILSLGVNPWVTISWLFCHPHDFMSLFLPRHCSCCCNVYIQALIPTCSCEGFLCCNGQSLSIYSSDMPKRAITKIWHNNQTNCHSKWLLNGWSKILQVKKIGTLYLWQYLLASEANWGQNLSKPPSSLVC